MRDYPKIGTHVRAMRYLRGSVDDGTHAGPDITFTGELVGTPANGVHWVAINTDRALLPEEAAILECTGGRILTRRYAGGGHSVLIAESVLTSWTFEPVSGRPDTVPAITLHVEEAQVLPAEHQKAIETLARAGRMGLGATPSL